MEVSGFLGFEHSWNGGSQLLFPMVLFRPFSSASLLSGVSKEEICAF